jgi:hypothetical protein
VQPKRLDGAWPVNLDVDTQSWSFYRRGSCSQSWKALELFPRQANVNDREIEIQFDEQSLGQIHAGLIHISHVEATTRNDAQPKTPDWVEAWSINLDGARQLKNSPFFRTPDLAEILETLEHAALKSALTSAEARRVAIFNIVYRKEPDRGLPR